MIVIFNLDGSVYDSNFSDYVQQGSNGANMLQVAYVDSSRDGLSAYLIAGRPNSTRITLPARRASFYCNGERYHGWQIAITGSFTLYAGTVRCTVNVVDEDENILANYPFEVTVNATGNPIDGRWDQQINVAQYNEYMAQLSDKAVVKRVDTFDELPDPGQSSVIYLVGGGSSYGAYAWDADLGEYRAMGDSVYVLADISQTDLSGFGLGQVFYDKASDSYYAKTDTSPYYALVGDDKGVLGGSRLICRFTTNTTISRAYTVFGKNKLFAFSHNNKDYLYFVDWISGYDYKAYAFDIATRKTYMNESANAGDNLSSILTSAYEADLDLGNKSVKAAVFKVGDIYHTIDVVSGDMVLGTGSGDILLQPSGIAGYVTDYTKGSEQIKQHEIANTDFALDQSLYLYDMDENLTADQMAYVLRENAVIDHLHTHRFTKAYEDNDRLYFACDDGEVGLTAGILTMRTRKILVIDKGDGAWMVKDRSYQFYAKDGANSTFAASLTVSIDPTTYVMTLLLKNARGGTLSTQTVDLPLESIVSSATYYDTYTYDGTTYTKVIVITLSTTSVPTIVPVGDLISGLEKEACVEIPVSPTSGTFTQDQMDLLALDNASIKIGGYTYLHKVLANQFIAKSAFVSADGYKTESEYKVVVQNNGNYTLTSTTVEFYDKSQIDAKVSDLRQGISGLDDRKANKDGRYESLTAGLANNFDTKQVMADGSAYNFRPTASIGSTQLEVGSPCKVKKIVGGSVSFNQLIQNGDFADTGYWSVQNATLSVQDNVGTFTRTSADVGVCYHTINVVDTHKYILCGEAKSSVSGSLAFSNALSYSTELTADTWKRFCGVLSSSLSYQGIALRIDISGSIGDTLQLKNIQLIDLTQMFGSAIADYIYSLEQAEAGSGVAWFKRYFPKEYYSYNIGELVSVKMQGKKITHFNQLVTQPTTGSYPQTLDKSKATKVLPNVSYVLNATVTGSGRPLIVAFDLDGNLITADLFKTTYTGSWHYNQSGYWLWGSDSQDYYDELTFAKECYIMLYYVNFTSCEKAILHFHYDGERDGEYEPYESETYPCDDIELRGIPQLDDNNNLAFDGDEYLADGTKNVRYGIRAYQSGDESDSSVLTDMTNTIYALETPTTDTLTTFTEVQECDNWGTEEWLAPTTDTRPCEVPVGHETDYLPDLKAKLEVAPVTPSENGVYVMEHSASGNSYTPIATWLANNGYVNEISANAIKENIGGALRHQLAEANNIDFDDTAWVDLGSLTWVLVDIDKHLFRAEVSNSKVIVDNTTPANLLSSSYKTISTSDIYSNHPNMSIAKGIAGIVGDYMLVVNDDYTDETTFKNAMKGIILAYEKAS